MEKKQKTVNSMVNKMLLVAVNVLITILGTVLLTIGYVLRFRTEIFSGYLTPLLKVIPAGGSTGADVWTLYNYTDISLIVVGSVIVLIGVTGCIVGTCPSQITAIVYLATMGMIILSQITGTALLVSMNIESTLLATLRNNLLRKYAGDEAVDEYSQAWNCIFVEFDCCAVETYTEFDLVVRWDRKTNISGVVTTLAIPETCCNVTGDYPNYVLPYDSNCTQAPMANNSNYLTGCYDPLQDYLHYYHVLLILCECSPVLLEAVAVVLAVMVTSNLRKWKKTTDG